ncbi:hypothetical protein SGPA1_12133 [Streptomyces misionensis JCM 4497]
MKQSQAPHRRENSPVDTVDRRFCGACYVPWQAPLTSCSRSRPGHAGAEREDDGAEDGRWAGQLRPSGTR